jgi:hypothetical protein
MTAPLGSPGRAGPVTECRHPEIPPPRTGRSPPGAIGFARGSRREPDPDDRRLRADPQTVDRLLGGAHHDPHAVLGAHPHDNGTVVRVLRPHADEVHVVRVGGEGHPLVKCTTRACSPVSCRAARRLPARRALRRPRRHRRRPLPLAADPRRSRPAPDLRRAATSACGMSWAPTCARTTPRRAPSPARASRCGRPRRRACASPATSTAGAAGRTPCAPWAAPACGSCSSRASARAPVTSSGSSAPTAAGGRSPTRSRSAPRSRPPRRPSWTRSPTSGATTSGSTAAPSGRRTPSR